jgi:hypothetical protein
MEHFEINVAQVAENTKGSAVNKWFARVYTMDGAGYQDVMGVSLREVVQKLVNRDFSWHPTSGITYKHDV